jgi:DNA-binding NarL/FixJ family response regulator
MANPRHTHQHKRLPGLKSTGPIHVLLVDSSLIFREGIREAALQTDNLKIIGEVGSNTELVQINYLEAVDVILLDGDLIDFSSINMGRWLRKQNPELSILLLSNWDWDVYLVSAWHFMAAGMILRREAVEEILRAIRNAHVGLIYSQEQFERIINWEKNIGNKLSSLNPREYQVLKLVIDGKGNADMANVLNVTENTIEKHISNILRKMQISSRSALLSFVLSQHLDIYLELNLKDGLLINR